ncbi:hypothetical protein HPP92_019396 [Vanilla planifolia]|uniref:Uncharacterized protein n=1 Tax=Vanilla planifolia TaxID=51239 RepID=A0A835UKP9_VANPL|nr:hypothetical protein HPP92_019396 [Vanilla planifolia]
MSEDAIVSDRGGACGKGDDEGDQSPRCPPALQLEEPPLARRVRLRRLVQLRLQPSCSGAVDAPLLVLADGDGVRDHSSDLLRHNGKLDRVSHQCTLHRIPHQEGEKRASASRITSSSGSRFWTGCWGRTGKPSGLPSTAPFFSSALSSS